MDTATILIGVAIALLCAAPVIFLQIPIKKHLLNCSNSFERKLLSNNIILLNPNNPVILHSPSTKSKKCCCCEKTKIRLCFSKHWFKGLYRVQSRQNRPFISQQEYT
jgi:hypothetical protein